MLADLHQFAGLDDIEVLARLRGACRDGDRSPTTLLNLAIAEDRTGQGDAARRIMQELAALLPEWDEPQVRLAESLRRDGRLAEAERAYAAALEINPRRQEALVARAALLIAAGDSTAAQSLLLRCIGINPGRAEAWDALGLALLQSGDAAMAESAFAEAQRLAPAVVDYALRRLDAAQRAGTLEAETARLQLATENDPLDPVPFIARGVALDRLGRRAEAIDALETACALAPAVVLPAALAGRLMARANRVREAEAMLRRASALDPGNPVLRNDHAAVLMRLQRHAAARDLLEGVLRDTRPDPGVLCNLATALVSLGQQEDGENTARRAIALDPGSPLARRTLANALPYRTGIEAAELLAALDACAARLPRGPAPDFANTHDPERPLRVGLLSGSLRAHPVGWLTVAGFEALDPTRFRLIALAQTSSTDAIARRFRAIAAEWHEIDAIDDAALAALARERNLDLLIDLGGYGDSGRLAACAYRLAPVQVKWVGMQAHSTGLPEIDWFLSDRWETPPELEQFYSERILRLPDGYVCYSPPAYAPDVGPLPAATNGFLTFGCFNNLAKVTDQVIRVWADILHRVPASVLVLKTYQFSEPATADRVRRQFATLGIADPRIELRGASPHREFMAEYNQIDMVLDPFPYSGGLTTCEALWMGVPTVTLPGETFASRHSMSHLSNAGLGDWVAGSLDDYARLATTRASDLAGLARLREQLRAQVKASPLCDAPRFGRHLGAALRHAWMAWCQQ
ncbi:MAG TPA: tetratricopeptide repeat protein, partial [Acetobacteraceae bacterium]|nr:tetratricopeptide repeat protein [Acetobacteraceae bacterium]